MFWCMNSKDKMSRTFVTSSRIKKMTKWTTVILLIWMTIVKLTSGSKHKNVLVLVADDMGFEIGAYNNSIIDTPNLDKLSTRGVLFKRAYTSVSSCSPSRSAILTGLPQHQNGMYGLHHPPNNFNSITGVRSISGILKSHGIRTGIIGKKHVGPESVYPFDFSYTEQNYNLLQVGRNITFMKDLARKFLQETKEPFFLYIGFYDPHRCMGTDEKYGLFCEKFGSGQPGMGRIPDWNPRWYDPDKIRVPFFIPDNMDSRQDIANQYTSINRMDQGVGLILKELELSGHMDDTLVLFTSDNGIPFPAAKTNLYTPGMGEPMILSSPVHRERWGKDSTSLVSLLDIVPTILDWYSIPYPSYRIIPETPTTKLTGRSMLPILQQEPISGWNTVYASHDFHEVTMSYPMRVIQTQNYKLIHNLNYKMPYPLASDLAACPSYQSIMKNVSTHRPVHWYRSVQQYYYRDQWELYDQRQDPKELSNLVNDERYSNVLRTLRTDLFAWLNRTSDIWYCLPQAVLEQSQAGDEYCLHMYNGIPGM